MKPKYLVIPENRWKEIGILLSLSTDKLHAITKTLRSKEALKSEESSYQRIAKDADISHVDSLAILGAVTNLVAQRQRYSLSNEQLLEDLEAGSRIEVKNFDDQKKRALLELLSESEEGYLVEKAENLKTGFAPHFVTAKSICDVRPVFDKKRESIEGILLVTFLGLTTHDEEHNDHTFVLQLTRSGLRNLQKCLEEAERKLGIMEQEFGAKFDLFS